MRIVLNLDWVNSDRMIQEMFRIYNFGLSIQQVQVGVMTRKSREFHEK